MNEFDTNFNEIVQMIEVRRNNAYKKVNEELISLYWDFGKHISEKISSGEWGNKRVNDLEKFMREQYPTLKGFNRSGMYRMKQFYETYKDNEFVSPLVRQISWTNNMLILGGTKTIEEKEFYIKMCIKNNYTKRELDRQISSGYYERYMLSEGKALPSITKTIDENDYPNINILDTYSLEFLNLPSGYSEKDLRKSIIENLKDFILEIGKDFSFVGDEYKVQVGNHDYFIDLLFYSRALRCLVAFELKIGEFKPEYISKMDFYLETLDRKIKKKHENPSIGIILCANKDDEVVEYAMSRTLSPTMVAEYKLNLINKELLQEKLREISDVVEENSKN